MVTAGVLIGVLSSVGVEVVNRSGGRFVPGVHNGDPVSEAATRLTR
jgi:hypothetical protein